MDAMKKGQIEMMGLVVAVIIIVIGLLFYLKYGVLNADKDKSADINLDNAYVSNLMQAMFKVEICENTKFENVVEACFNNANICSTDSCSLLNTETSKIFGLFNDRRLKNYSFWIESSGDSKNLTNNCKTGVLYSTMVKSADNKVYRANLRTC